MKFGIRNITDPLGALRLDKAEKRLRVAEDERLGVLRAIGLGQKGLEGRLARLVIEVREARAEVERLR